MLGEVKADTLDIHFKIGVYYQVKMMLNLPKKKLIPLHVIKYGIPLF